MTLKEQIAAAKAQIALLESQIPKQKFENNVTVKIGEKGTLNFYGLSKKFPVCLYLSQLVRLREVINSPAFEQFMVTNTEKIARRSEE